MIYGRVTEGKATIPVTFCLPSQPDFSVDFVIDTGFNDYLTLPLQAVNLMNLPLYSSITARLAPMVAKLYYLYIQQLLFGMMLKK